MCVARKEGRTTELPGPRARKALPLKRTTWWVLLKKGRVLLEKRPSSGLWGGLLTFPERADDGWRIRRRQALAIVEHGFTHFRLRATPILCVVDEARREENQQWLALARVARAPLPTPVKRLLLEIAL
jgi:A/G-specific adenine glycosylase